ncbi:DUF2306 domain-containing protein [Brevibacterium jeotgali]|uniref:Uncharacterized membrane protein n=1 Tax=Brevibacterium jeotgali TaxID=1262550 RepID=A0A2H1L6G0_9MICO|nr:DUF2306 domain-containing protein [Brevibacterium jeotgali]TWB99034.1 putative membrane protein [Brevibacterium jeotgali]SMY12459.1 Uncharacterized membrane protein [Brevibacterium jeotgali]
MGTLLATVIVIVHASTGFLAIVLGPVNMLRRRRDAFHRVVGRTWVGLIWTTCLSGLFIVENGITVFHALAVFTIGTVTLALWRIRRGDPVGHAAHMIGSYLGLLIAFGFAALLPARLIQRTAASDPVGLAIYALVLIAALGAWMALLHWLTTRSAKHSAAPNRSEGPESPEAPNSPRLTTSGSWPP